MRRALEPARVRQAIYNPMFDAMVALHRGEIRAALSHVAREPGTFRTWHDSAWRPWYAAMWAEAGVLAALPDRRGRLDLARFFVLENPVAAAIVDRADAIDLDDADRLVATADALAAAGCRYQYARTLVFAGGDARTEGEQILAAIGAASMMS
jgi:hypothetical protein